MSNDTANIISSNLRSKILNRTLEQCLKLLDPYAPRDNGRIPQEDPDNRYNDRSLLDTPGFNKGEDDRENLLVLPDYNLPMDKVSEINMYVNANEYEHWYIDPDREREPEPVGDPGSPQDPVGDPGLPQDPVNPSSDPPDPSMDPPDLGDPFGSFDPEPVGGSGTSQDQDTAQPNTIDIGYNFSPPTEFEQKIIGERILRHVRIGSIQVQGLIGDDNRNNGPFNYNNPRWLPAIFIESGSDERVLKSPSDTKTTPIDSHPESMVVIVRLVMIAPPLSEFMSMPREDQYQLSNPIRAAHIRRGLDFLLDPSAYLNITHKREGYNTLSRVKSARISNSYNLEGVASPFEITDFRVEIKFERQTQLYESDENIVYVTVPSGYEVVSGEANKGVAEFVDPKSNDPITVSSETFKIRKRQ